MRITFNKHFYDEIDQMASRVSKVHAVSQKEARHIAHTFISVEVTIFLLRLLRPNDNKIDAIPFLFYSLIQPSLLSLSPLHKRYLANLHALLPYWKSKRLVFNKLRQYSNFSHPKLPLHVEIDWKSETFMWRCLPIGGRERAYEQKLGLILDFQKQNPRFFTKSKGQYYDNHVSEYRQFSIPEKFLRLRGSLKSVRCDHVENRDPIVVSMSDLLEAAKEMDQKWQAVNAKPKQWENRLRSIQIQDMNQDLRESQEIKISGMQHWVGPLSVGKSSLLEVLSYFMVKKREEKVTLIVPDVPEMFRLIDQFDQLGINAVPIMSHRQRQNHIQQYLQSFSKEELEAEGLHLAKRKSFRFLSAACFLKTMEEAEPDDVFTTPPCFRLQDVEKHKSSKVVHNYVCPFFSSCDYHKMYHDLDQADIYVTNINSLLVSTLPAVVSENRMLTLEYVLRRSSLILVDEADAVQNTVDGKFIPHEELKSDAGGWLSRLESEVKAFVDQNPSVQWQDEEVIYWLTNVSQAQVMQAEIRFLLENPNTRKAVRSFIGKWPFTGKGLLARLGLNLAGISVQQYDGGLLDIDEEQMNQKKEVYEKITDLFFRFYTAYMEDDDDSNLEDSNLEERVSRLKDITDIADRWVMGKKVETFLKDIVEGWQLEVKDWEEMKCRFLFALRICNFEKRLHVLTNGYAHVADLLEVEAVRDTSLFRGMSPEYQTFVPINPLGIQFGFRYDGGSEVFNQGGTLSVFRYVGVGRYILQFFNQLFLHLDDKAGAHTVLLSATSFAPGSTRYHIKIPVQYALCRRDNAQPDVEYVFCPGSVVSGKVEKDRTEALRKQMKHLIRDNYLLNELNNAPPGRQRALLVTGSYDEAKDCAKYLNEHPSFSGKVYALTKKLDPGDESWQIERQKVTSFAETDGKILIAPRAALERGLNILTPGNQGAVAAFSLLFYLVRPYPVPYDLSGMASLLNDFAMENYLNTNNARLTLYEEMMNLKQKAYQMQREFFRISYGYRQLGSQRIPVLMDLLVSCAQLEGRLIRGSVPQPAKVIFLDESFSPPDAKGKVSTAQTSMLSGWEEVLNPSHLTIEEQKLIKLLYGFRQQGLKQLKKL